MSTTGHLASLPRSTLKWSPTDPAPKQVWLNLPDDLGDTLQLSPDLASFLAEDTSDKWSNTQCLPAHSFTSTPILQKRDRDQWHSTPPGGAQPKASTASSTRPVATGWAPSRCSAMPYPVEHPGE